MMRRIFAGDKYKLNIIRGDFLSSKTHEQMRRKWGTDAFDLVMGNPPFQRTQYAVGKRGGGDLLWDDFVVIGLDRLKTAGHLVYVHPPGWRKPGSERSKYKDLYPLMTTANQMVYLEIHGSDDGQRVFKSGTRYDWYVLRKQKATVKCVVVDEAGKTTHVKLGDWPFLPNRDFQQVFRLVAKPKEPKCRVLFHSTAFESRKPWVKDDAWVRAHPQDAKGYKKVLVHSTPQSGVRWMWTNDTTKDKHYGVPMFGVPKVILGESGVHSAFVDADGRYAMTQGAFAIAAEKHELSALLKFLQSDVFGAVDGACRWGNFRIDWRMFTYFRDGFWKQKVS